MENIYCPICTEKGAAMTTPIVLFPCTHTICGPCFIAFLESESRLRRQLSPCPLCARPVMVGHWSAPARPNREMPWGEWVWSLSAIAFFFVGLYTVISWARAWTI